jgi:hypothetical protein
MGENFNYDDDLTVLALLNVDKMKLSLSIAGSSSL